jgi:hypothetical protein
LRGDKLWETADTLKLSMIVGYSLTGILATTVVLIEAEVFGSAEEPVSTSQTTLTPWASPIPDGVHLGATLRF